MRRNKRLLPMLERESLEPRVHPSGIIAEMAATAPVPGHFPFSTTSIALPTNQGPQATNLALTPTGTATARELKRERFLATFVGTYTVGPGRFSSEAQQIHITGAGGSNDFLHGDIQISLVVPKDPSTPIGGVSSIFDRNLNSNAALGLDLTAPQSDVDAGGRPNNLSLATDVNISAGPYVESYSTGLMSITYIPSAKHTPGVISEGKAIVRIQAQIYTLGINFILANANIDP